MLVRYVDRRFRTLGRKHRAVAGASMGGFGAMKYAARHRRAFVAAASFSGYVDTMFMAPLSGAFYHHAGRGVLDDANVAYTSDFYNGYHHWPYWQQELHRALPMLYDAIR